MSSELTLDIQLTELGFSSWDFQLLQKERCPSSELEHDATPLSQVSAKTHVDEEADISSNQGTSVVCLNSSGDHDSLIIGSAEKGSKGTDFKNNKHTGVKRRKVSEDDDEDDELVNKGKKPKMLNEQGSSVRNLNKTEVGKEEEESNDEESDHSELTDNEEENYDSSSVLSTETSGSEEHNCPVCSLTFSSTFLLQEHLHIHSGVRLYNCAECGKQFCHLKNYRNHLRSHDGVDTVQCIICTTPFATQADLQRHLDTNHFEDKFYQCDFCKRIFTSMEGCQSHVQTHMRRPKGYPCPKCEQSFSHRSAMLYHLKRHKKAKLVCQDCGMMFTRKVGLLRHSFSHLGLRPYTCVRCKQHFRLGSQYRKHECKPEQLQCVACLVVFQSKDDFEKHKKDTGCWGHQTAPSDGAIDIRCMECGQVFDSSEELKKHAGTHQRVMSCSECGKGFRSSFMLMSHMGGHAAQRPVLCKECGLGFCHQQGYDSHLKTCGLVKPAEAAMKKSKPKVLSAPTVKGPKTNSIHPTIPVGSQIKAAEPLLDFTLNNDPSSPVSLVMLMPVPLTPSSENISDAKNPVSAPHGTNVSVPSTSCALKAESSLLPQEGASYSRTKLLVPLSDGNDDKKRWTVLDMPTSGSTSKTNTVFPVKKNTAVSVNAENGQKKAFSAQQILHILDTVKKKQVTNEEKVNLPTVIPARFCEKSAPSSEARKSSVVSRVNNHSPTVGMDTQGDEKMDFHSSDMCSFGKRLDVLRIKEEPEQCADSKPVIHSLPELSSIKSDKSGSKERVQKPAVEKDPGSQNSPEPDVQCEICGKMLLEKDLGQHIIKH